MNLTLISNTPKALIDTTVLCGAILTDGINRKLLRIARTGIYQPIISNVCLLEFVRNASKGIGNKHNKRVYTWEEIEDFLEALVFPSLQGQLVTNSTVSRDSYEVVKRVTLRAHHTIGQALLDVVNCSEQQVREIVQQELSPEATYLTSFRCTMQDGQRHNSKETAK